MYITCGNIPEGTLLGSKLGNSISANVELAIQLFSMTTTNVITTTQRATKHRHTSLTTLTCYHYHHGMTAVAVHL
jgi:hypothetical protein